MQGGLAGTGNIDTDPGFVSPANLTRTGLGSASGGPGRDLHLAPGSPCIDAGDNLAVPTGITIDLDGSPRFKDDPQTDDTGNGSPPIVDMRCFEY